MQVVAHSSYENLSAHVADLIGQAARAMCAQIGQAYVVLPGGSSPRGVFECLAEADLPWDQIWFMPTDERCVSSQDPASNAGQIKKYLPQSKIIELWKNDQIYKPNFPELFTVTVLGMGEDGHIASLFPGQISGSAEEIYATKAPRMPHARITLSLQRLLQTRRLLLLGCGSAKTALIQQVAAGHKLDLPLSRLLAAAGDRLEIHTSP